MPQPVTLPDTVHASGKDAGQESFPVASWLLPPSKRAQIMAFYRFARAADDIADHPALPPEEKLRLLNQMEGRLPATGAEHAAALLVAFRQDAGKARYADWDELMGYCRHSAAPVGRFLLDLFGEDRTLRPHSDALCAALQVLNHVQDCGRDYRALDRLYLPKDWLDAEGATPDMLAVSQTSPALRRTLDRVLDATAALLAVSCPLLPDIRNRGLRIQAATTQIGAEALLARLRQQDPLTRHVRLGWPMRFLCLLRGISSGMASR
ncbi:squalene/phytoene synthase family protein [Oceanibaculum indicum]|uniref:Phytoene/squalene synthetase n=1 Tax=Oceanibaculum indicum P24 TaxID=1207063 RepID=K2IYP0_9PROT|nr:squalene/phytoene synthase family protein [Oceanibaculum indicum]EKE75596.1 phytoene/squalene synthetase [Oceanibaculum indicum P24]